MLTAEDLTREELTQYLICYDIQAIEEGLYCSDYSFLIDILNGSGFTGYDNLTDEQILEDFNNHYFHQQYIIESYLESIFNYPSDRFISVLDEG
jgi:hypothetical protein